MIGTVVLAVVALLGAMVATLGTKGNNAGVSDRTASTREVGDRYAPSDVQASQAAPTAGYQQTQSGRTDSGTNGTSESNNNGNARPNTNKNQVMPTPAGKPQIIYTGGATIEAKDVAKATVEAHALTSRLGGYVSGSKSNVTDTENAYATLTLRVPSDKFDDLRTGLGKFGEVKDENTSTDDVTLQATDLATRINNQKASIARIRALYAKAATISDITALETELANRESTYNSLLAQQAALRDKTAMSTYTVMFSSPGTAPAPPAADENPGLLAGLKSGWKAFSDTLFAIGNGLGKLAPFAGALLILAAPVYLWWRKRNRRGGDTGGGSHGSGDAGQPSNVTAA